MNILKEVGEYIYDNVNIKEEFSLENSMDHWNDWKDTLRKAVNLGDKIGLTPETMANVGSTIGSFLSNNVDPENKEQRLLKELWSVANENEKETMTNVLIKMIKVH